MLMYIKLHILLQLGRIASFLSEYQTALDGLNFEELYSVGCNGQSESYTIYHHNAFPASDFRRLCVNEYTIPFRVTRDMNLTHIFGHFGLTSIWVDLYKSKITGLLLDKTDYPPVTTTIDTSINPFKILTPNPNSVPSGIVETHYTLEAEVRPKVGDQSAFLTLRYQPVYNTSSVIADLGITDPQVIERRNVLCLSPNVYPNSPFTKAKLKELTTSMSNQLLTEKVEYTRLKTEWKLKNKALLVAEKTGNQTFKIDETLDVDALVRENLATCKQTKLEIISYLSEIKKPY